MRPDNGSIARIADKYIRADGSDPLAPEPIVEKPAWPTSTKSERINDIACVGAFLAFMHPREMSGGRLATDAFDAFCRLAGIPSKILRKALTGSEGE